MPVLCAVRDVGGVPRRLMGAADERVLARGRCGEAGHQGTSAGLATVGRDRGPGHGAPVRRRRGERPEAAWASVERVEREGADREGE